MRRLYRELRQLIREVPCLFGYHRWVDWGRRHCERCGKIDWADSD